MNLLVSGLSGFIGSNWKNYVNAKRPEWNVVPFHRNLIGKQGKINAVFDQANLVIHLAGKAHDMRHASSPHEYYMANTDLTKLMFDAFLKS
jgi:nucleoside-diphosphate-sugar epimerase